MPQMKIDLNRADKDQLTAIDGVDEELAARIIAFRKTHGPFQSFADLEVLAQLPPDAAANLREKGHVEADPMAEMRMRQETGFVLRSAAFEDGAVIPQEYTCDGADVAPPLEWSGAPPQTRSFALLLEDPDAPGGTFRHWAIYDVAGERTRLPEGTTQGAETERLGYGLNDFGTVHYRGPCPPEGHGVHHYHFRLAALDVPTLRVPEGATAVDVWEAAAPHILAEARLVGTYER